MNRPWEKGGTVRISNIAPAERFAGLWNFLKLEAAKGSKNARFLLHELGGKYGQVDA